MHLFALFIAAVFSTQFTPLSNPGVTFKINSPKFYRNTETAATIIVQQIDQTTEWAEDVTIFLTLDNDPPSPLTGGNAMTPSGTKPNKIFTSAAIDIATALTPGAEATVRVWVVENADGTPALIQSDPVTITITDKWWMTYEAVDTDSKLLKNVIITGPKDLWDDEDDTITLHLSHKVETTATADWKAEQDSESHTANVYTIGDVDISEVPFTSTTGLFAYVSFESGDGSNVVEYDDDYVQIPVTEAVAKYTISPATVPVNLLPFFTSLAVTPVEGVVLGDEITVEIKAAGGANPTPISKTASLSGGKYVITFTPAEFAAVKAEPAATDEYVVSVATAETAPDFLGVTKTFELTAGPTYEAAPEEFQLKEWKVGETLTLSQDPAWSGAQKLVLSLVHDLEAATSADVVANIATPAGEFEFTLNEAAVGLVDEDELPVTVFVYVVENSATIDKPPTFITVVPDVPLFVIDPDTLTGAKLETPIAFTVEPRENAGWTAGKMTITFSLDDEEPTEPEDVNAIPFTFPLAAPSASGQPWTVAAADLSTLAVTAETTDIYAWVANNEVYAEEYVKIPFTPTTTFTIPTTSVTFADAWKVPVIALTPEPARNWAELGNKLKFCYSVVAAASNTPVDNITGVVTKTGSGSGATYSIPETPLATFELTAADLPKRILVEITEDDWTTRLGTTAHIALVAGSEPEETTFTLTPNQINWAAEVKLLETEITPSPEAPEDWPTDPEDDTMKFEILNPAAATVEAVKGTVVIKVEEEEDEETVQWFIPADTNIKSLVADEPTADVPLTVRFTVDDGTNWITKVGAITVKKPEPEKPEAAMGVSPLLSLLAALVFLFVKLF